MKKTIFGLVLGVGSCIYAAYAQAPSQSPVEFTFKVDAKDIDLIGEGLGLLPYNRVAPLMQKLQIQLNQQGPKPNPNPAPVPTNPNPE